MAPRLAALVLSVLFLICGCSAPPTAMPAVEPAAPAAAIVDTPAVAETAPAAPVEAAPATAPVPETDTWTVVFQEDLSQVELKDVPEIKTAVSANWIVAYGPWEGSAEGIVKKNQDAEGVLLCRVPVAKGALRVEYEAMSETPGDLSLILGTRPGFKPYSNNALFFGFGMNANLRSKIVMPDGMEVANPVALIVPGTWHKVAVERSGGRLTMEVDSREVLRMADTKDGLEAPYIAFYGWHAGAYRYIRVLSRPDEVLAAFLKPEAAAREAAFPTELLSIETYAASASAVAKARISVPGNPRGYMPSTLLAGLFKDRMILQRDREIPVWGWTGPQGTVTVELNGTNAAATAGADGRWMVRLPAMEAGGPYTMTVAAGETVKVNDIYVGEVWVASGQSNMQMALQSCRDAEAELAAADYPLIRFFRISNPGLKAPAANAPGQWIACEPASAGSFSGAAYFFARYIHKELGIPVGIIQNAVGGMPAEAYTPWEQLMASDVLRKDMENIRASIDKELNDIGYGGIATQNRAPAALWNALVNPAVPYAIRGAIWYQGESNASRAVQYQILFPLMIKAWREAWGQGDFPFLFVQLASYMKAYDQPSESRWADLREAQTMTLDVPATGMALAIDIGEADDIHPRNKQDVGLRLGLAAMHVAYGRDIVYSGPQFERLDKEAGALRIHFSHVGGGLVAKDGDLKTFAVAGADGVFAWAQAVIDGDTVVVSSPDVPEPVKVRYAWADNPAGCNLYNAEGLPAVPFRAEIEN